MRGKFTDLTGKITKFGILIIKKLRWDKKRQRTVWLAKCPICGSNFEIQTPYINQNKSCGCIKKMNSGSKRKIKFTTEELKNDIISGMTIRQLAEKWGCDDRTITKYRTDWKLTAHDLHPNNPTVNLGRPRKKEILCYICKKRKCSIKVKKCKSCNHNIMRYALKSILVKYMGGKCCKCGYNKCLRSLHFHHINNDKNMIFREYFTVNQIEKLLIELQNCVLVCANCHAEIHDKEYFKSRKRISNLANKFLEKEKVQEKIEQIVKDL